MKLYKYSHIVGLMIMLIASSCQKNQFNINQTSVPTYVAKIYYVSPDGSDANLGTNQSLPFKTVDKASSLTRPGDIVYLLPGTYNITNTIFITNSGNAGNYISYKGMPNQAMPKLAFSGGNYNALVIAGSYIKFEGIEMQGDNANLTLAGAMASYNSSIATTPVLDGKYNMNGMSVGPTSKTSTAYNTHVEIRNCVIHDFPAGGLGAGSCDYVTFENNTVYNNSWYTIYATSGIGLITPYDSDNNTTTYRFIIRGNKSYNNKTLVPWISTKAPSDGNGIIIDVNTTSAGGGPAYTGRTLVENNISFNNGGSGIHAFSAGHVDIINNTAYSNGQVLITYANIFAGYANDVKIMNNIMYARTGGKCNTNRFNNAGIVYDYNIYYNGTTEISGTHDIVGDPQFVQASTDPLIANFQLQASSPAVNAGNSAFFSKLDFLGNTRPKGAGPDCGAYESF